MPTRDIRRRGRSSVSVSPGRAARTSTNVPGDVGKNWLRITSVRVVPLPQDEIKRRMRELARILLQIEKV